VAINRASDKLSVYIYIHFFPLFEFDCLKATARIDDGCKRWLS
jgi:hypothetical protein